MVFEPRSGSRNSQPVRCPCGISTVPACPVPAPRKFMAVNSTPRVRTEHVLEQQQIAETPRPSNSDLSDDRPEPTGTDGPADVADRTRIARHNLTRGAEAVNKSTGTNLTDGVLEGKDRNAWRWRGGNREVGGGPGSECKATGLDSTCNRVTISTGDSHNDLLNHQATQKQKEKSISHKGSEAGVTEVTIEQVVLHTTCSEEDQLDGEVHGTRVLDTKRNYRSQGKEVQVDNVPGDSSCSQGWKSREGTQEYAVVEGSYVDPMDLECSNFGQDGENQRTLMGANGKLCDRNSQKDGEESCQGSQEEELVSTENGEKIYMMQTNLAGGTFHVKVKLAGRTEICVLDSGCTHSVMSQRNYESLPCCKRKLVERDGGRARLADGSSVHIAGTTSLEMKLGAATLQQEFLVADVASEILLGMDFFRKHNCVLDFAAFKLQIGDVEVSCCDSGGKPLVAHVQNKRKVVIPAMTEMMVEAALNQEPAENTGVVEQKHSIPGLMVASTLHDVKDRQLIIRLANPTPTAIEVPAGRILGMFLPAEPDGDSESDEEVAVALNRVEMKEGAELPSHLQEAAVTWCKDLKEADVGPVKKLLYKYQDIFSTGDFDIGRTGVVTHSIRLKPDAQPVRQRPYRHAPVQEEEIERQVSQLKEHGLITEGHGAWSSPVVLVKKKNGKWRFCVDYRKVNQLTEGDAYPLPRIDDSLDALGGNNYYSTVDMTSSYWQVELDPDARERTAFVTRSGLWEWKVLPFGLMTAPSTFERLVETVMRGLQWKTLLVYLDDLIIFSPDLDTHLERLEEVFKRLQRANLKLKPAKCNLFTPEVEYLGHVVGKDGIKTDPKKIKAVEEWPQPQHKKDVRAFLGLTGYYRRFIPLYADKSKPLTQLTTKHATFHWEDEHQQSFEMLKQSLLESPILKYPDFSRPFVLDTDASNIAVGAVLGQGERDGEVAVAYYSKMLSAEETRYCATRKELLAVVKSVKYFRHYLLGRHFKIRTDHAALTWLVRQPNLTGQVARWVETLSEFSFTVEHRRGLKHMNADALSRQLCQDCTQCQRAFRIETTAMDREMEGDIQIRAVEKLSDLARQQQQDKHIGPVYKAKQRGAEINEELYKEESWETKQLAKMAEHLSIRDDGVLMARLPIKNRRRDLQICPRELRDGIIKTKHEMAHLGMQKTLARIQLDWWWPGMVAEVRRYVRACNTCQQSKVVKIQTAGERQHLFVGRPFQKLAVDLVGPFEETEQGNAWILVVTDHYTRWSDAIAIPNATAKVVANTLDERIFCYLGVPEVLHTDQGSQFESELFKECCRLWGAKKTRTAPYTPTANAVCERGNKTLGASLRALMVDQQHRQWDLLLSQIMRTVRATPHTTTGETPNYLTLGREVRLPEAVTTTEVSTDDHLPVHEYAQELHKRLEEAGDRLRAQQHQIRLEDTEEPSLYTVGDKVWLKSFFKKRGQSAKLHPKYVGPYTIVEVLPHHVYKMERNGRFSIQHEGRIRLHTERRDGDTARTSTTGSTHPTDETQSTVEVTPKTRNKDGSNRLATLQERRETIHSTPPPRNLTSTNTRLLCSATGGSVNGSANRDVMGCDPSSNTPPTVNLDLGSDDSDVNNNTGSGNRISDFTSLIQVKPEPRDVVEDLPVRRSTRQSQAPSYLRNNYYMDF